MDKAQKIERSMPSADYRADAITVDDDSIKTLQLLRRLPRRQHLYAMPFVPVYVVCIAVAQRFALSVEVFGLLFGILATAQMLVWLSGHWNTRADALTRYKTVSRLPDADSVRIVAKPHRGVSAICQLHKSTGSVDQSAAKDGTLTVESAVGSEVMFTFHRKKFMYDGRQFRSQQSVLDSKPTIGHLLASSGLSIGEYAGALAYYGENRFDIPVPTFSELFKEHAVAPFFVFQIFCVALWCLDEYWYYSLFTLVMLFGLESMVVLQRQRSLREFRGMSVKPYPLWVLRNGEWTQAMSDTIVPRDIVSITRHAEDAVVPCDAVLLDGSCVVNEAMLSGESTPVILEGIRLRPHSAQFDAEGADSSALLHGGTQILQTTSSEEVDKDKAKNSHTDAAREPDRAEGVDNQSDLERGWSDKSESGKRRTEYLWQKSPPDGGIRAIVVRTGFNTTQGSLVRTMMFSTERVTVSNAEAFYFILFLLVFAIAAAGYVWRHGIEANRNRYKLLLDCILIVTSVVPPELPMELSLAVNSSLSALSKYFIFCVEPFRIPLAGKVDICCFDKTGTLTAEQLVVEGFLASNDGQPRRLRDVHGDAKLILATAHDLVRLHGEKSEIVGDPMEKAVITDIGWDIGPLSSLLPPSSEKQFSDWQIQIVRRFKFTAQLKRQSSVVALRDPSGRRSLFVAVKGAPEVIAAHLSAKPSGYDAMFSKYGRHGSRVIALAFKKLPANAFAPRKFDDIERAEVESDLSFAGFVLFNSPIKDDAAETVQDLNGSSHICVMITGDNPLTASFVAKQVHICTAGSTAILDLDKSGQLVWRLIEEDREVTTDIDSLFSDDMLRRDICVTGAAFTVVASKPERQRLVLRAKVWARVSPVQKEEIIQVFRQLGLNVLMCGDGTNDVGALKQAQVGVALLNSSESAIKREAEANVLRSLHTVYEKQMNLAKSWNLKSLPMVPKQLAPYYPPGPQNPMREQALEEKRAKGEALIAVDFLELKSNDSKQSGVMDALLAAEDIEGEAPKIKLGDASVAAPFTSKLTKVDAITKIIRQGRCTLVATIQMYKILALNCLISAYALSVLYLAGIKYGDGQMTISGLLMSLCFMCISHARPLNKLSVERPQSKVFTIYTIGSILAQFAIHVATLIYIARAVGGYSTDKADEAFLEKKFEPSLLNSAMYLLQLTQQISTFAVNFIGHPFRESLSENKLMFFGLAGVSALAFSCSQEIFPMINQRMRLVKFSDDFQVQLGLVMIIDFAACYLVENVLKYLFISNKPEDMEELDRRIQSEYVQ